jgi:hypothetical protein
MPITVTKAAAVMTLGIFAAGEVLFPFALANDPNAPQPESFELSVATIGTSSGPSFAHSGFVQDTVSGEIMNVTSPPGFQIIRFPTDVSSGSTVPRR